MLGFILSEHPDTAFHALTVDGVPVHKNDGHVFKIFDEFHADIHSSALCEKVLLMTSRDVVGEIINVHLNYRFYLEDTSKQFYISGIDIQADSLGLQINFDMGGWNRPWGMDEYIDEFKIQYYYQDKKGIIVENPLFPGMASPGRGINIYWNRPQAYDLSGVIRSRVETIIADINIVHKNTINNLNSNLQANAVITLFDFPEIIKVPCEQYLLYFVQFLRDIGIEATAELKEEAGQVLFAVTPKDKAEALDNIREALDLYLHLPGNPHASAIVPMYADIESQRLAANIHHLQGQLLLAQATMQQKDILIQQQQNVIQQQLLSGQILIQSIQKPVAEEKDKEPLVGDIVSVKEYDWEFLHVDLPTLIRRFKEKFGRKNAQR